MSPRSSTDDFLDTDLDEYTGRLPAIKNTSEKKNGKRKGERLTQPASPDISEMLRQEGAIEQLEFSYTPSRHEREWMMASLSGYYNAHWFTDVLKVIRGGKEASVYLLEGHPSAPAPLIAGKIYRPRRFRNLKKDHLYREGRDNLDIDGNIIHDGRMQRAMQHKTHFGQELLHTSWIGHEFQTMQTLHEAGADIPEPFASGNNAILMGYIGDRDLAAPTLDTVELGPAEARQLFQRVLFNIELMLAHARVHADLSAYNILYWQGEITLIDFPQAIDPHQNRSAFRIFERDVLRVCEYFSRQGVKSNPRKLAVDLWTRFKYRTQPEPDPHYLDDSSPEDRVYWENTQDK